MPIFQILQNPILMILIMVGMLIISISIGLIFLRLKHKGVLSEEKRRGRIVIFNIILTIVYSLFLIYETVMFFITKEMSYLFQALLSLLIALPIILVVIKRLIKKKNDRDD